MSVRGPHLGFDLWPSMHNSRAAELLHDFIDMMEKNAKPDNGNMNTGKLFAQFYRGSFNNRHLEPQERSVWKEWVTPGFQGVLFHLQKLSKMDSIFAARTPSK